MLESSDKMFCIFFLPSKNLMINFKLIQLKILIAYCFMASFFHFDLYS